MGTRDDTARTILDEIAYAVLATADADGRPWASPVWFATDGYSDLYWISRLDAQHSRNLAARPEVGLVVFDSRTTPAERQAVYLRATAGVVTDADELARGVAVFSEESVRQGLEPLEVDAVGGDAPFRLFHARVQEHFVLADDRDVRLPVKP